MSGTAFTPIPAVGASGAVEGFRPLGRFRTSLPVSEKGSPERWFPPLSAIPGVPAQPAVSSHSEATPPWPAPLTEIPAAPVTVTQWRPEIVLPGEKEVPESPFTAAPDYSDEDLGEALAPLMRAAVKQAVYESERGNLDAFLEPMLRATVRRALAEYSPASARPFQPPGFLDRTVWRMQALFSSRSFEDVLFEKTHRFQVEEVFLLDAETLALVSFASCDPARHSTVKRVENSAQRIALQLRDDHGTIQRSFERADGRNVICEAGERMLLVAVVRGQPNELILADLGFSLHRIENHFRERFAQAGSALMHALQPFLEDCLLIQAPGSAA